jgi:hypothetical protein
MNLSCQVIDGGTVALRCQDKQALSLPLRGSWLQNDSFSDQQGLNHRNDENNVLNADEKYGREKIRGACLHVQETMGTWKPVREGWIQGWY